MAETDIRVKLKLTGLNEFKSQIRGVGDSVKKLGKEFKSLGANAAKFGRNVAIAGTATATLVAGTVKAFSDFEKSFTEVSTLLDESSFATGTLEEGIEGLKKGVLDLGRETGETFENLNQGLFDLVSAGVPAGEAIGSLAVANKLALAGATETSIAVDGITSAMGAYGEEAGTAEEIAQKFFTAQKGGKTTVEELAGGFGLVGSTAAAAGVSFNELLAATAATTLTGKTTASTYVGLRGAIVNIQKPTADAIKEAKRLGIVFNADVLATEGLSGILEQLSGNQKIANDSFVKLFGSVEGAGVVQALLNDELGNYNKILGDVNNEQARAENFQNALKKQTETLSNGFKRFTRNIQATAVEMGKNLAPGVSSLTDTFTKFVTTVTPALTAFFQTLGQDLLLLSERFAGILKDPEALNAKVTSYLNGIRAFFKGLVDVFLFLKDKVFVPLIKALDVIGKIFGLSGGQVGLILLVGQLSGAFALIGSVVATISALFGVFSAAAVAVGGAVTLAISPIILIVGAIVGLIAAIAFVIHKTIGFEEAWRITTAFFTDTVLPALEALGAFLAEGLGKAIDFTIAKAKEFGSAFLTAMTEDIIPAIKSVSAALFDTFILGIDFLITKAKEFGSNLISYLFPPGGDASLQAALLRIFTLFQEFAAQVVDFIVSTIPPGILEAMGGLGDALRGLFTEVFALIGELFRTLIQGITVGINGLTTLIQGIRSTFAKVVDGVKSAADKVKSAARIVVSNDNNDPTRRTVTFAGGGHVRGPGTATSDSIPAMLSDNEFVMKSAAVKKYGVGFMAAINRGLVSLKGFASGGLVSVNDSLSSGVSGLSASNMGASSIAVSSSGRPLTLNIPGIGKVQATTDETTARRLEKDLRRSDLAKAADRPRWYR